MGFSSRIAAVAVAAVVALPLVAADDLPPVDTGTASSSLISVEVDVTGLADDPSIDVLDVDTYASNDPDPAANPEGNGSPFARTSVVPLRTLDQELGAVEASSDGNGSSTSTQTGLATIGSSNAPVAVDAGPVEARASATVQQALASIDTSTARVEALLGALGLDVEVTELSSTVTQEGGARSVQALTIAGLDLSLGDLVPADVLGQLPLTAVLNLLDQLPVGLSGDLPGAVSDVTGSLTDLQSALSAVTSARDTLLVAPELADLQQAEAAVPTVTELVDLHNTISGLLANLTIVNLASTVTTLTSLLDDLSAVGCAVTETLDASLLTLTELTTILQDTLSCLEGRISTEVAGVPGVDDSPANVLSSLQAAIEALGSTLRPLAGNIIDAVDAVGSAITQLQSDVGTLEGLLAELVGDPGVPTDGLIGEATATNLISMSAVEIGTSAIATGDPSTSSASFICDSVSLQVLGRSFETPDCSEGAAALQPVTEAVSGTVNDVTGLLSSLPLGGAISAGELRIDLLSDVTEQVGTDSGYTTARASGTLLELALPSLTIDPSAVTGDLLGGIAAPGDVGGTVTGALDDATSELTRLGALSGVTSELTDLAGQVTATDGLADRADTVTSAISGLETGQLGTLAEPVGTPGLTLTLDPSSSARLLPAAQPEPDPTPEPSPDPEPSTGPSPDPSPTPDPEPDPDPEPTSGERPGASPSPTSSPDPAPSPDPIPTDDPTVVEVGPVEPIDPAPDPEPQPAPDPDPVPALPRTGGGATGLALMLGLGGAVLLRRRRR